MAINIWLVRNYNGAANYLHACVTCAEGPLLLSGSLEALFALALGPDTAGTLHVLNPCLKAYSPAALRAPKPLLLATVASESLWAEGEPTLGLLGCASASILDSPFLAIPVLDVELVVEASEATDMRSRSAGSVSDESPSRARLSREVRVGLGLGTLAVLAAAEAAAAWGAFARLVLVAAPPVLPVWALLWELLQLRVDVIWESERSEFELMSSSVRSRDVQGWWDGGGPGVLVFALLSWGSRAPAGPLLHTTVFSFCCPASVRRLWITFLAPSA